MEESIATPKKVYTEKDVEECPVFQAYRQMWEELGTPGFDKAIAEKKAKLLDRYNTAETPGHFVALLLKEDVLWANFWRRLKQEPYCLHAQVGFWEAWLHRGYWDNLPGLWWMAAVRPPWIGTFDEWGYMSDPPGYPTPVELLAALYASRNEMAKIVAEQMPEKYKSWSSIWQRAIRIQDTEERPHHEIYVWNETATANEEWAAVECYDNNRIKREECPTFVDALKLAWKWIEHPDQDVTS